MRIAVVNWSNRRIGGVETYLGEVVPAFVRAGHEVGFFCETDIPHNREPISLPGSVPVWSVEAMRLGGAVDALRAWKPDIVYAHKLHRPSVEARVLGLAKSVFFAHDYYGACISGLKTFKFPRPMPCHRRFGPACLALYFPRRCGGRSPITMLRLYVLQARRLAALRRYDALVTHSEHMRREYLRLGFPPERVHRLAYTVPPVHAGDDSEPFSRRRTAGPFRLLFLGRMDPLKGGHYFLEALCLLPPGLLGAVQVTFAGDGPSRGSWQRLARRVASEHPAVRIAFPGWIPAAERTTLLAETDLLVMPSLWPEPFGRSGPEAGRHGIPAVAYDVGGISEWLVDGVNGYLAPGIPPTPGGLSTALRRFLEHPEEHARLAAGAVAHAQRFAIESHVATLTELFDKLLGRVAS